MSSQPWSDGSRPVWPAPDAGLGEGVWLSGPDLVGWPRARPAADLFQPVTGLQPPPAVPIGQVVAPVNGASLDGPSRCAGAPQSKPGSNVRQWASHGSRLVAGTPGAVIAVVASAMLVLAMGAMTLVNTSSSAQSPQAELATDRLPTPATPAIRDEPVTVSPLDASAGFARQTPPTAPLPQPAARPAYRQPAPTTHRTRPEAPVAPPASHYAPLSPPHPAIPPSAATADDPQSSTVFPGSPAGNTEPPAPDTGPCHCDAMMPTVAHHWDYRSPGADNPREPRAGQQAP
jgi:hypothetical protein